MKVADLYIACALIGAFVAIGWSAREHYERQQRRMQALETRVGQLTRTALTQSALTDDVLSQLRTRETVSGPA